MGNILRRHHINRALISLVLTSFTMTYAVPLPAIGFNVNIDEAAFIIRLEKLVEKLVKSEKKGKGIDSMIGYLVDIKTEIELQYNMRFNIDEYMDQVGKEIKKQSGTNPKKELDLIKKKIKKKDKKQKGDLHSMASMMYIEGYPIGDWHETLSYSAKHEKDKEDKEEEVELPSLLVYGVTCTLCGLFLMVLPMPSCKEWGGKLVMAGVTACANSLCTHIDDNKKDKDKK